MQIPAKLAALASAVFAAVCLWFALDEFSSLPSIADPAEASGVKDFAWFWTFLAAAGAAIGWVTWKVSRAQDKED